MSIINKIESLINEIESLLKNQNLGLNENTEINDLIKTKKELIRRIENEFLGNKEGMRRALSYLDGEENKPISEFLEYLLGKLSYLKDLIEKELVLDKSGEIEREIEILHFELKTILGIKDNEYFKNLVGLHTRFSQTEEEVLEEHKDLIGEDIKILTSNSNFSEEYKKKLKEVFSTNKGIFLLRLLKENCESSENYKNILKLGFAWGVLRNPIIQQLEINELLEVIREFINLTEDCENDETYLNILRLGFAWGVLRNPIIQQLEINELLEVIKIFGEEFINLRKDCENDETYLNILYWGFADGILRNPRIQQLEINELLEVIGEFINLRKDCENDETYLNILYWGFADGILRNPRIQQLEINELLEVIGDFQATLLKFINSLNKRENVSDLFELLIGSLIINMTNSDFDKDKNAILKNIEENLTILLYDINDDGRYSNFYNVKYLLKNKIYCFHSVNAYFGGMIRNEPLKKNPFENLRKCLINSVNFIPSCSIFKEGRKFDIAGTFGVILNFGYIYKSYVLDGSTVERGNYKNKEVNVYRMNIAEYESFLKERRRAKKNKENIKISNIENKQFSPYVILKYFSNLKNEVIVRNWTPFAIFYIKGKFNEIDRLKEISDELSFKKYINGERFYRKFKLWDREDDFIEKIFPIYEVDEEKGTLKEIYKPDKKE